jgi:hypothetical protein
MQKLLLTVSRVATRVSGLFDDLGEAFPIRKKVQAPERNPLWLFGLKCFSNPEGESP